MYHVGDLFDVKGERLLLKEEDDNTLLFYARRFNQYYNKKEFINMVQSGAATLIQTTGKERQK